MGKIRNIIEQAKQAKVVLLVSMIFNLFWAVGKIFFGVFTFSYFFCVSGASSLLFGFVKQIYLKNYKTDDLSEKIGKSITIAILLIVSSLLFTFYMARLFFIPDTQDYGLIMSITIASFSFFELGFSIYNFVKAKREKDILLQSFRGCSLASSCFAIVLTQVALLSATKTPANFYNGLTGVVFGLFSALIGAYLLIKAIRVKSDN